MSSEERDGTPGGPAGPRWEEPSLRLPGFDAEASEPVRLADGQVWYLRRPTLRTQVAVDPETGRFYSRSAPSGGVSAVADLYDDLARRRGDFVASVAGIAVTLLRLNYDLPDDAVPDLFVIDGDDPRSSEMWGELGQVIHGGRLGPKPSAGGSSPAP